MITLETPYDEQLGLQYDLPRHMAMSEAPEPFDETNMFASVYGVTRTKPAQYLNVQFHVVRGVALSRRTHLTTKEWKWRQTASLFLNDITRLTDIYDFAVERWHRDVTFCCTYQAKLLGPIEEAKKLKAIRDAR